MNDIIMASVTLKSRSGLSIHKDLDKFSFNKLEEFSPKLQDVNKVAKLLTEAGFTIEAQTQVGISFSGPKNLFESEFGVSIQKSEMVQKEKGLEPRRVKFFESKEPMMSERIMDLAETVQISTPGIPFHNANHPTPSPTYYFLDLLNDLPDQLNVSTLHSAGINGEGVRVSMIDTGFVTRVTEIHQSTNSNQLDVNHDVRDVQGVWLASDPGHTGTNYFTGGGFNGKTINLGTSLSTGNTDVEIVYSCIHPHYTSQGYNLDDIRAVGGTDVNTDEYGHGTAEAANIMAAAPECTFSFVKIGKNIDYPLAGFQAAVQYQNPDVITCSWGAYEPQIFLEIVNAVANGIVVIFSAGNGHTEDHGVITHPNLISVGGAYPIQGGGFRASDYSSSFESEIYTNPQRHIPDIVGLVGEQPMACLIMLPTEPNNTMDNKYTNFGSFPNGDNTANDDGWCVCSGIYASAPQIAGMVALLLQKYPNLTPMAVKNILENSARDIQTGSSCNGDNAAPGWDAATGFGLINGQAAIDYLETGKFNVFIRDRVEDNGNEPGIDGNLFTSPDIIVRNELVVNPQDELGQTVKHRYDLSDDAEDGHDNYIYLRVQNRGELPGDCTATVYFTDPGMFSNPTSWTKINNIPLSISNLNPGEFRVVGPIIWPDNLIPASPQIAHYCLISVLDSPSDPAPNLNSIQSYDDFCNMVRDKNNMAWKNIDITPMVPGGSHSYSFYMEGPQGKGHQADLQMDLSKFPADAPVLIKVLRRFTDTSTSENMYLDSQSDLYSIFKMMGGIGNLKGMNLKSNEKSKVTITYSIPENTPDGDYPIIASLLVDGNPSNSYTDVARISHYPFVGNRSTHEVHKKDCPWVEKMRPYHKVPMGDLEQAHRGGYDNCAYCIGGSWR